MEHSGVLVTENDVESNEHGQELQTESTDFEAGPESAGSVSRFHIAPILDQDGGEISCEVANRFGRDSKTFLLSIEGTTTTAKKQLTLSFLWMKRFLLSSPFKDVPSAPGLVRLSAIKSRSLEISWSRPHDGNSPILNYIIEYSNLPGYMGNVAAIL